MQSYPLRKNKRKNKEKVTLGFEHKTLDQISKRLRPPAEAGDPPYGLDTGTGVLPPNDTRALEPEHHQSFSKGVLEERTFNHIDHAEPLNWEW